MSSLSQDPRPLKIGTAMARIFFDKHSKKGGRNIEVHLSEIQLAALLTIAAEEALKGPK